MCCVSFNLFYHFSAEDLWLEAQLTKYQEAYLTLNLGDYSTQLFIDITIYNKPVPMDLLPVAMQVSLLQLCPSTLQFIMT